MSFPSIFKSVCDKNGWPCEGGQAEITLAHGRRQFVFMEVFTFNDEEMIRFYTVVGRADMLTEVRLRAALGINFGLPYGALAIHRENLVLTDTFLVREADYDEVESSIRYIANTADRYERLIFDSDEY